MPALRQRYALDYPRTWHLYDDVFTLRRRARPSDRGSTLTLHQRACTRGRTLTGIWDIGFGIWGRATNSDIPMILCIAATCSIVFVPFIPNPKSQIPFPIPLCAPGPHPPTHGGHQRLCPSSCSCL